MTVHEDESMEHIRQSLLPAVSFLCPGDWRTRYEPHNCLAIYYEDSEENEGSGLEFPALLVGQLAISHYGQGCTLLQGIPAKAPEGSIVIGLWDTLRTHYPDLLDETDRPSSSDGYYLRLDKFAMIAGNSTHGCVHGAQTLVQMIAAVEDDLPSLTTSDEPRYPYRAIFCDLRGRVPEVESVLRIAGVMSSFKGNRLHLELNGRLPIAEQASPGTFAEDTVRDFVFSCWEYGVSVVPWIDILPAVANQTLSPQDATQIALRLNEAFGTGAIGLTGDLRGTRAPDLAAAVVDSFFEHLDDGCTLYLEADTLRDYVHGSRHAASICAMAPPRELESARKLREAGHYVAVCAGSLSYGFAAAPLEASCNEIDDALEEAQVLQADEIVYHLGDLQGGHLWENETLPAMTCLAAGWNGTATALPTARRFAQLAYGEFADRVMAMHDTVSHTFAGWLDGPDATAVRNLAFGYAGDAATWDKACAIDWADAEQRIYEASQAVSDARGALSRNTDTLRHVDVGLDALHFLHQQVVHFGSAIAHYEQFRSGQTDKIATVLSPLETLVNDAGRLIKRLGKILKNTGSCTRETEQLKKFQDSLQATIDTIRPLSPDDAPPPESIGLPPVSSENAL